MPKPSPALFMEPLPASDGSNSQKIGRVENGGHQTPNMNEPSRLHFPHFYELTRRGS